MSCCRNINSEDWSFELIILRCRQNKYTTPVNLFFAFVFVTGLAVGGVLIPVGQTPLYLLSWIPYLFIFGSVILFGLPLPFVIEEDFTTAFSTNENTDEMTSINQFLIGAFFPAPFAISSLIYIATKHNVLFLVLQIMSHLIIQISGIFLLTVYFHKVSDESKETFELVKTD